MQQVGFIILQGFKIVHYQRPKSIVTELNVRNLNLSFQNLLQYFRSIGFKVNKFSKEYLDILYAIFMKGYGEGELAGEIEANKYWNQIKENEE